MTFSIQRPCKAPGCRALIAAGQGSYCPAHHRASPLQQQRTLIDQQRGSAHTRGYDARWRRARLDFLARYPVCTGVLLPTDRWSLAAAREYHHRREQARLDSHSLATIASPAYRHAPWDVGQPATEVDHIIPHRGDPELLWAEWNWQSLTKRAHSMKTGSEAKHRQPSTEVQP